MTRKEALLLAIENEIKSQNFYKFMGKHCENKVCNLFYNLVPLEKMHEEKLRKIFEDEFPGEEINVKLDLIPTFKFHDKDFRDPKTIYELGISKEEDASSLYKKLADETKEEDVKDILLTLAKEEDNHAELLRTEIEALTHTMIWFDESELNGFMED